MDNLPENNNFNSPYNIYNNTPHGATPQYHYGVNRPIIDQQYMDARRQYHLARRKHSKSIKHLGTLTGVALLILLVLSNVFSIFLVVPSISELYSENFAFSMAFYVFYSVITIGFSFFIVSKLLSRTEAKPKIAYNSPKDKTKSLLLILIGFGGCLAANYITSIIRYFAELIGIYSDYSAIDYPTNAFDVFLMFVSTAAIPALIEEYAFRGVLLSSFKKYGNKFAILSTAFVFAIFHANAVQIPFAFMCGLILGYAVISSGSIWVGVIIHALTNGISCISSALILYISEDFANKVFMILMPVGICIGILSLVLYIARYKNEAVLGLNGIGTELDLKTKFGKFISSPAMIISIIILLINTIVTLSSTPTTY